jgi:hypothetical protein
MPAAKGIVVLDKTASVRRTKNVRDGFEYCIRIDAPNSATSLAGTKSWPKLVMALRSNQDMEAWLFAIRSVTTGVPRESQILVKFHSPAQRTDNMIVYTGSAMKEV